MSGLRIRCCVPFCTRTRGDRKNSPVCEGMEWICAEHWQAVPARYRRAHSRAWNWTGGLPYRRKGAPIGRACSAAGWRIWERCKRAAIEGAMRI